MLESDLKCACLPERDLRLQYSGFIIFAAKLLSVATGLVFQFMVARATSLPEYDIWYNINDIAAYFTLLAGVLPFWTMRFVARGKEGSVKTGVVSNLIVSVVAAVVYVPLVPLITSILGVSGNYVFLYLLMAIQIIEIHSIGVFEACLQAKIPRTIGYGLLIQQVGKVALGYALIVWLGQPLLGAVVATMAGFFLQSIYYVKLLAEELRARVRWEYVKQWLKGSAANVYNLAGNQLANFVFIMLFANKDARGTYGAAFQVVNVVTYASFLAFAMYPKLLAERNREDVATSLKMVLMFTIPMTAGAIVLSDLYIAILKPEYAGAGSVLTVLAVDAFIMVMSGVFSAVLYGMETLDEDSRISFRQLAKSRMFLAFSLPYVHSAIAIPTVYYMLTTYAQNLPFQAALYVGVINASARLTTFIILLAIVRKMVKISFPWKATAKYLLASGCMSVFLFLVPHISRISTTLLITGVGGLIYVAVLATIDKEARTLPRTMLKEIRNRKQNQKM